MRRTYSILLLSLLLAISACAPMVISIYQPVTPLPTTEYSMCGWPSLFAEVMQHEGVVVEFAFSPSSGVGLSQVIVRVPPDTTFRFREQKVKVESNELPYPAMMQFGRYYRGTYGEIGLLTGPVSRSFFVETTVKHRPGVIVMSLPEVEINGKLLQPKSVSFSLSQKAGLVGLCQ